MFIGVISGSNFFSGFINLSASSIYSPFRQQIIFKHEKAFKEHRDHLDKRLFISYGDKEHEAYTRSVQRFMDLKESRNYEGLQLQSRVIDGERHSGLKAESYNRSLRWIFKDLLTKTPN